MNVTAVSYTHLDVYKRQSLRGAGIRTQVYTEPKKFKAKMNYANKLGIPFVAFLGEDEVRAGKVTVKNMLTGEQESLDLGAAPTALAARAAALGGGAPIREPANG